MSDLTEQLSPLDAVERDETHKAFREVMATVAGKRAIYWMLQQCAIYRDPFCGENNATNYTIGSQRPGRMLIAMLDEVDPNLYPDLLKSIAIIRETDKAAAKALSKSENAATQENDDDED